MLTFFIISMSQAIRTGRAADVSNHLRTYPININKGLTDIHFIIPYEQYDNSYDQPKK